jgi:hypothetical protein
MIILMLASVSQVRVVAAAALLLLPQAAFADLMQSSHFRLDPNVAATFGGDTSSQSFKLTATGGETVVGAGGSQSYQLGQGYVRELVHSLTLTVVPSGTYAYWPLDTGSGTVGYDVGANGDDLTLMNTPAWATGMVGQAVTLNGSSQYLASRTQVSAPTAFTLELWFKSTSTSGGYLAGFGDAATGASSTLDRLLYLTNAGNVVFGTKPGTIHSVTSPAAYNDGSWHHVAASMGTAGLQLYVDGVKVASDAATTTGASYSGYWRFGYDSLTGWPSAPTSNYAAATLDELHVVSRQLRDAEVANDYTAGANALQTAFTLPNVTPGTSQSYAVDAVVRTDAGGYDLYVQRPKPLTHTDGSTTIPDLGASIGAPAAWTEGSTKGFGFTVTGGTSVESKWGTGPSYNYAALPAAATIYHSRTGLTGGVTDTTTMQYRADTSTSQKNGTYFTQVIYTATMKP